MSVINVFISYMRVCINLDEVPFGYLYVCFISMVENAIKNKSIGNNVANPLVEKFKLLMNVNE